MSHEDTLLLVDAILSVAIAVYVVAVFVALGILHRATRNR